MDDLKLDDDLKPDSSDRRPTRSRKPSSGPKLAVSRQHMMIGIGILVLLLIIIAIGSALKAPTEHEASQRNPNVDAPKSINLSDTASLTSGNNPQPSIANNASDGHDANGVKNTASPQEISAQPIASTPTQAVPQPSTNGSTQRVELPGDISDALTQTQGQVDTLSQNINEMQPSTLPTAAATVATSKGMKAPATREAITHPIPKQTPAATATKQPAVSNKNTATTSVSPAPSATPKSSIAGNSSTLKNAPANHYTLQLSSASRADTLDAYAKQQKLTDYHVYETKRDGKSWYILVSGNYASSADAKRAIATLPADVQAKKPWAKPVQQVQQDLKK